MATVAVDWHDEAEHGCTRKTALGERAAKGIVAAARAQGNPLHAYRCPWVHGAHWHVGHCPSLARLVALAAALRARAQDPAA